MGRRIGDEAKIYYNDTSSFGGSATWASPTWIEIGDVLNVNPTLERNEVDITARGDSWAKFKTGKNRAAIEVEMLLDEGDESYEALRDAYVKNLVIDMLVLTGPVSEAGHEGPRAECRVLTFSRSEPSEGAITVNATLRPTDSANTPMYVETTGTSNGITDISV